MGNHVDAPQVKCFKKNVTLTVKLVLTGLKSKICQGISQRKCLSVFQ